MSCVTPSPRFRTQVSSRLLFTDRLVIVIPQHKNKQIFPIPAAYAEVAIMDICALKQIISMLQYPISQIPSHLCRADGSCMKKKKKKATSNHMCNKWCWICSCGVTTDGALIVLLLNAHFRHTFFTAQRGFSTWATSLSNGN